MKLTLPIHVLISHKHRNVVNVFTSCCIVHCMTGHVRVFSELPRVGSWGTIAIYVLPSIKIPFFYYMSINLLAGWLAGQLAS